MAINTVSQVTSIVKENNPIRIDFLDEYTPVVSSLDIARHFQKKHQNILRDIDTMQSNLPKIFNASNFEAVKYTDAKGEKRRSYSLTRDAFTLLVMGFTGKAALQWKLRYIEVFNALEAAVRENIRTDALEAARSLPALEAQRKAAYLDGMKEGQRLQKRRDGLAQTEKALGYVGKGITLAEAARFVGCAESTLRGRVRRIRRALSACIRPVQGRLLEVPRV